MPQSTQTELVTLHYITFLAYWNEVKPEDERVKSTESLEIIPKKELRGGWKPFP